MFVVVCPSPKVRSVVGELFPAGSCCPGSAFGLLSFLFPVVVVRGDACLFLVGVCCCPPIFGLAWFSLLGLLLPGVAPSPSWLASRPRGVCGFVCALSAWMCVCYWSSRCGFGVRFLFLIVGVGKLKLGGVRPVL